MKRVTILLVALILVLASAASVAARTDRASVLMGQAVGFGMVEPDPSCPPVDLRSVFTATGQATHLDKFELDYYNCTPEGSDVTGIEMIFMAADGDEVFATYEAHDVPPVGEEPALLEITYDFEIVGGTGTFVGATGGGQMMAAIEWPGYEPNYWPTTLVIEGTITY